MSVVSLAQLSKIRATGVSWARWLLCATGTYLATITHDSEVQPRLPQVLIGNERQFTATIMNSVDFLPSNVHLWRCKSAWNSHMLMRRYLSLLASSLGSALKERYVILILDGVESGCASFPL